MPINVNSEVDTGSRLAHQGHFGAESNDWESKFQLCPKDRDDYSRMIRKSHGIPV